MWCGYFCKILSTIWRLVRSLYLCSWMYFRWWMNIYVTTNRSTLRTISTGQKMGGGMSELGKIQSRTFQRHPAVSTIDLYIWKLLEEDSDIESQGLSTVLHSYTCNRKVLRCNMVFILCNNNLGTYNYWSELNEFVIVASFQIHCYTSNFICLVKP